MRNALAVVSVLIIAALVAVGEYSHIRPSTLHAQAVPARAADPTMHVHGSGSLPAGWKMRFDPTGAGKAAPTPDQITFEQAGSGYHFKTGEAAIYYNPKDMGSGEYLVSATFSQKKSMGHEAYGIFIGGKNLQDSTPTYIYLVIKPCRSRGDCKEAGATLGEVLVSQRTSDGKVVALFPTAHSSLVNVDDPTDGHATNNLTIHVAKDTIHFVVNDRLATAIAKSQLHGATTDGQAGLRINHNLDINVDWKGVSK